MTLIHELYLKSKRIHELNDIPTIVSRDTPSSSPVLAIPSSAKELLPTAQSERFVWMKSMVFKNTEFMHMQVRLVYLKACSV
jgi:hypothetical protein